MDRFHWRHTSNICKFLVVTLVVDAFTKACLPAICTIVAFSNILLARGQARFFALRCEFNRTVRSTPFIVTPTHAIGTRPVTGAVPWATAF
jgi:hypothetical protein